jgi:hypothetical protein
MRQLRVLAIALTALFAMSAIAATAALAEAPELLSTKPSKFTSVSGTGALVPSTSTKATILCKKDTDSGEFTTIRSGTVTIDFTECTAEKEKVKCRSLGDALGTILTGGVINLVALEPKAGELLLAGLVTIVNLHLECQGGLLVIVNGSVIGSFSGVTSGVGFTKATQTYAQTAGIQAIRECVLPKELCKETEHEKHELLTAFNGEPAEPSGEETKDELNSLSGSVIVDF